MKQTQISGNNWDQALIFNRTETDFDHDLPLLLYFIKEHNTPTVETDDESRGGRSMQLNERVKYRPLYQPVN